VPRNDAIDRTSLMAHAVPMSQSGWKGCWFLPDTVKRAARRVRILVLTADDRTYELPVGYSERLHGRLAAVMQAGESSQSGVGSPKFDVRKFEGR
jgi:hypothetical protein